MEGEVYGALQASLSEDPSSLDDIAGALSARLPVAASRGAFWLERELERAPFATRLEDGRWVSRPVDDELAIQEENGARGARRERPHRRDLEDPRIAFHAQAYSDLWTAWSNQGEPSWLTQHVEQLRRRYLVDVSL